LPSHIYWSEAELDLLGQLAGGLVITKRSSRVIKISACRSEFRFNSVVLWWVPKVHFQMLSGRALLLPFFLAPLRIVLHLPIAIGIVYRDLQVCLKVAQQVFILLLASTLLF
jgi:hypothetical protein